MVSIISFKLKVFCDTGKCFFRCSTNKLRCSTRIYLGSLLLLKYINDLPQALNETGSYLITDDTCRYLSIPVDTCRYLSIPVSFIKISMLKKQKKILNKELSSLCEWFIDSKLPIHFRDDKAKTIFFSQMKSPPKLNISYRDYSLKQHNTVEYLVCTLILILMESQ